MEFTEDLKGIKYRLLEVWGVLLWGIPITIAALVVIGFFLVMGWCKIERTRWPFIELSVSERGGLFGDWFRGKWRGWHGFNIGILCCYASPEAANNIRTVRHERMHGYQFFALGVLQMFAYSGHSVWIFFMDKKRHAYYDNWAERMCRSYAGQQVDIPPSQWRDGPTDRWAWW